METKVSADTFEEGLAALQRRFDTIPVSAMISGLGLKEGRSNKKIIWHKGV
jgi:hypothetical protein